MNKKKKITLAVAILLVLCLTVGGALAYLRMTTQTVKNTFTMGAVVITLDERDLTSQDESARTSVGNHYNVEQGEEYVKDPTVTVKKGSEECYVRMLVRVDLPEGITTDKLKNAVKAYIQAERAEAQVVVQALITDGWLQVVDTTKLKVNLDQIIAKYLEGWDPAEWVHKGTFFVKDGGVDAHDKGVAEYRYKEAVAKDEAADTKLPALFTGFKMPDEGDFPALMQAGYSPIYILNKLVDYYNVLNQTDLTWNGFVPTVNIVAQAVQKATFGTEDAAWEAAGLPINYEEGTQIHNDPITLPTP